MMQMIKRDYYINKSFFLIVALVLPFIYVLNLSPLFIYIGIILGCTFNLFYYDGHNHVSRYIVGMPVQKGRIVLGRYIFIFIVINIFLIYLWLIDIVAHYLNPMLSKWIPIIIYQPITPLTIALIFFLTIIAVSLSVPIYYFFQSFIKSLLAQGVLLLVGITSIAILGKYADLIPELFITTILDIIDLQPVIIPIVFSFLCLYMSYKLSGWIFTKKDIA